MESVVFESAYIPETESQRFEFESLEEELRAKYGKVYRVEAIIEPDDETQLEMTYYFKRPNTASYDRYVKMMSKSMTKALRDFVFDNVLAESREKLERDLEEYPALTLDVGQKLLAMLGLTTSTNLKML
ncbi:DUF6848 family protein [Harryflintia acetispora]|uniref:DUF6848 domain-containing protein n=1 Tax=Harryflintia acetispora TaxID=1849041 RepID=A0A9X8UJ84_9FIRM|nr:hypothetical protein [Harryflintia acetispora]TCL43223.1 hypothetical protein EDD78_10683 [Harryflintia acetispora]